MPQEPVSDECFPVMSTGVLHVYSVLARRDGRNLQGTSQDTASRRVVHFLKIQGNDNTESISN